MRLWLTLVLWLGSSLVLTEESPPPSKRHKCPDAPPSKHVLCYHSGEIAAAAMDPCICTHVVLTTKEAEDGHRQLDGEKVVGTSFVSDLREGNPSLQLLLGVDAAHLRGAPSQKVSGFARSTADYIKRARLDGLEVDLGDIGDGDEDTTHVRRKEGVASLFKALREEMRDADAGDDDSESGDDPTLILRLPVRPESLAKTYDLKSLSKYVDYFTVSTHNITDDSETGLTYHHSRLMGLADILNTDSVLDLLTGMGAPPSKLIISLPTQALAFSLKDEKNNVARSPVAGAPKTINYGQVCAMMKEGGWTVERDEDLTAPYAFRNKTWVAFEDETSVTIKGKYALLRGLAGVAVSSIDADDHAGICGKGPFPLTKALLGTLTTLSRKPRGLILQALEEELRGGETVALPEASLGASVRLSPFRIVRVVDREGAVHVIRRNSETSFQCSRQGYFRHPLGCNQFYRCVKFDQLVNDFSVFEYDCPPGLAFDEKWEVCVWPGQMSRPCDGSSEIAPVPRARFTCPAEGYYADPENCRWFFACLDHHGDPNVAGRDATDPHSGLTAYEFRCPFGLAFDGSRLACEWPWLVPGCGKVEIGSGVLAAVHPVKLGYSSLGTTRTIAASNAVHHISHSDSGTVASVLGAGGLANDAHVLSGVSNIGGISHDLHSLGGEGLGLSAGHVASGGSLIGLGGAGLGYGAVTQQAQRGPQVISGVSQIVKGGSNILSGSPQAVRLGDTRFGNAYSYQVPVVHYESTAPVGGLAYDSKISVVTGLGGNLKTAQPEGTVRLIGVNGIGNARGVSVSNVGLSGIGSGSVGLHAIPTVAPLQVGLVTERPHVHVAHTAFDDAANYAVSVSTAAPTSRPVSLVKTNIFNSAPQLVTPTPITYQSLRPTFLPQENYLKSVPAANQGTSSFTFTRHSQPTANLNIGNAFGLGYSSGSEASDTISGSGSIASRPLTTYQSASLIPQTYTSATGPSSVPSYSLDVSPPRTGGLIPVRPIESAAIFTSSERPTVNVVSVPALDAAQAAAAASADGGSVGKALYQGSLPSLSETDTLSRSPDIVGLGQVRDDGHAVTGGILSRPSLVNVLSNYQEPVSPAISAPETRFSYKNLPLSIIDATAPVGPFRSSDDTSTTFTHQSHPQNIYRTNNVSPAPSLLNVINDRIRQDTISTHSTTPAYDSIKINVNEPRGGAEGFSYKHILPVVEFSTPGPILSRVPLVNAGIANRENANLRTYSPFFTTTAAPPVSIGLDDDSYGSRILYANHNEQPVAYTISRGTSGILHAVQPEDQISISYNPSVDEPALIKEDHIAQVKSAPPVFVTTSPQPPSTISTISYSTTPSPIAQEPTVFLSPARGSTHHRFYPTTTASPITANVYPTEQQLVEDVSSFQINRVSQNPPIFTTYAPPIIVPSVLPIASTYNDSRYAFRGIGSVPTFQPSIQQGHGHTSSSFIDNEGPVSISADVKASYGDRPSKRVKVDVVLKEDDDEPHISIETDSGNTGRGRFRYRARGEKIRANGKKKCDDDEEGHSEGQDYPNVDALLNTYSGNYGNVLSNSEREALIPSVKSVNTGNGQPIAIGISNPGNNFGMGYRVGIQRGDQRSEDDDTGAFGARSKEFQPRPTLGVSVNYGLQSGRSRIRGRYQPSNVKLEPHYSTSTTQYASLDLVDKDSYVLSSPPTVSPIPSSTTSYHSDLSNIQGKANDDISSIYAGNVAKGNIAQATDGSSVDLSHAAVIILPCGKLPALLAKLGVVTEGLKSIQKDEINEESKINRKHEGVALSIPPLNRYGPRGWDSVEKTLGNDACKRAGLFRHPQDCNRFYECFWDEWKGRYSLHEFKCPIRLAYDDSLSACNWPSSGPACSGNKLLV